MAVHDYKTIISSGEGLYKEKGSKFIGLAYPVDSIAQIEEKLQEVRKKYHDARHVCYAYLLNPEADVYRVNDDGEPNHSAGDPILGQIKSLGITNTLVVVVRYFGGTKLGVSGLIHAYKTAAAEALSNATVKKQQVLQSIALRFDYPATNSIMNLLAKFHANIHNQVFDEACQISASIPLEKLESLQEAIALSKNLGMQIDFKLV